MPLLPSCEVPKWRVAGLTEPSDHLSRSSRMDLESPTCRTIDVFLSHTIQAPFFFVYKTWNGSLPFDQKLG